MTSTLEPYVGQGHQFIGVSLCGKQTRSVCHQQVGQSHTQGLHALLLWFAIMVYQINDRIES